MLPSIPQYSKASKNRAYVRLNGQWVGLGRYGSPESRAEYDRVTAQWLANGRQLPPSDRPSEGFTVSQLCIAYLRHAQEKYKDARWELDKVKKVLKVLRNLYGSTQIQDFGPLKLTTVQEMWIRDGLASSYVADLVSRIRRMIRWAVARELVPMYMVEAFRAIDPIKKVPVETTPVPIEHIEAAARHAEPEIAALLGVQVHSGCRGGELCIMRPVDIKMGGSVWLYTPQRHKNTHRGKRRTIYLGPQCQVLLEPFLVGCAVDEYLFSPLQSVKRKYAAAPNHRRKSQIPNKKKSARVIREHYDTGSYRRAVARACDKAGVPRFGVHRVRHAAGTTVRQAYGEEATRLILGHEHLDTTRLYGERNEARAIEIAARIG
jgi:integrase